MLADMLTRVTSVMRYRANHPITQEDTAMVTLQLRSLDREQRTKTISLPEEESDSFGVGVGTTLRITVDVATPEEVNAYYGR